NRSLDLGAIAHDSLILHQPLDVRPGVSGDLCRIETVEGAAKVLALAQDGDPRKPSLKSVEHELLVECAIVVFGYTPFPIVIGDIERVLSGPGAAGQFLLGGSRIAH